MQSALLKDTRTVQDESTHGLFLPEVSRPLGVSARYILDEFSIAAKAAAQVAAANQIQEMNQTKVAPEYPVDPDDPSFYDIETIFWETNDECADGLCPRDRAKGCAVVDVLDAKGSAGEATHFLSWTWGYKVKMFVAAIRAWIEREALDAATTYLWICECSCLSSCVRQLEPPSLSASHHPSVMMLHNRQFLVTLASTETLDPDCVQASSATINFESRLVSLHACVQRGLGASWAMHS